MTFILNNQSGNDPGTDLRGVGLFGIFLLLRLTAKTSLVEKMFAQSSGETTNFPFCTCLLTLAKSTLALLKDGSLNLRIKQWFVLAFLCL